jgi:hypothetical protein
MRRIWGQGEEREVVKCGKSKKCVKGTMTLVLSLVRVVPRAIISRMLL